MKKFILLSLLATNAITNCVQSIDLHMQNLKNVQLKKVQELSDLSKQIAEKQALLDAWGQQASDMYTSDPALEKSLDSFARSFEKSFCEKKDIKSILFKEFSPEESYESCFIKVFLVRRYFERLLIAELIERYEKCLRELIELDSKPTKN